MPELAIEPAPEEAAAAPAWTGPSWLRLAYVFEFWIALIAIFTLWSQVGGQGHLDLLPWYTKLACALLLATCCIRFTAAMVERPKAWNRRSGAWLAGIILVVVTMGGITYYYHLHEVPDESDTDETTATAVNLEPAGSLPIQA